MKKQIFVLSLAMAAALSIPSVTRAEDAAPAPGAAGEHGHGGPSHWDPAARVKALKEKLSLSDDQATKIEAVFTDSQGKMKALHDDTALSADDRRTKARELMQSTGDQVKALLTPDQVTKYDEMQKQRREEGKRRGDHAKPADASAPK